MYSILTALLAIGILLWIISPLCMNESVDESGISTDRALEQRYAQAMLDLESDFLGGRVSDAEFEDRKEKLQSAYDAQKG